MPRILVIDDDDTMTAELATCLSAGGYATTVLPAFDGAPVWVSEHAPDLLFVCIDIDEHSVPWWIAVLRVATAQPIVALTRRTEADVIGHALEAGADNYLVKPVDTDLLVTWVGALLRRAHPASPPVSIHVLDRYRNLVFDEGARTIRVESQERGLTPIEFRILRALVHADGAAVSRPWLYEQVWEAGGTDLRGRPLDAHLSRLRRKIELDPRHPRLILTVRDAGYRLARIDGAGDDGDDA